MCSVEHCNFTFDFANQFCFHCMEVREFGIPAAVINCLRLRVLETSSKCTAIWKIVRRITSGKKGGGLRRGNKRSTFATYLTLTIKPSSFCSLSILCTDPSTYRTLGKGYGISCSSTVTVSAYCTCPSEVRIALNREGQLLVTEVLRTNANVIVRINQSADTHLLFKMQCFTLSKDFHIILKDLQGTCINSCSDSLAPSEDSF